MDEMGGFVVETEENPIALEDNAEERRMVAVIGLTATWRLGERFTKALEIIPESVRSRRAKERVDMGGYRVGFGNKSRGIFDGAHSEEKLRASTLLGAPLEFVREHTLALQCPPLLNVPKAHLDRLAAFSATNVVGHFSNIVREGDRC
jgi:hypothetical protein